MSNNQLSASGFGASTGAGKTYFEQQRGALISEIAMSLDHVLANVNKLNRSLEALLTVGNEFSSVEALWSQFEGVMARDEEVREENEEVSKDESKDETSVDNGN